MTYKSGKGACTPACIQYSQCCKCTNCLYTGKTDFYVLKGTHN